MFPCTRTSFIRCILGRWYNRVTVGNIWRVWSQNAIKPRWKNWVTPAKISTIDRQIQFRFHLFAKCVVPVVYITFCKQMEVGLYFCLSIIDLFAGVSQSSHLGVYHVLWPNSSYMRLNFLAAYRYSQSSLGKAAICLWSAVQYMYLTNYCFTAPWLFVYNKLWVFIVIRWDRTPCDDTHPCSLRLSVLPSLDDLSRASRLKKSGEWQITRLKWRFQTSERFVKLKKKHPLGAPLLHYPPEVAILTQPRVIVLYKFTRSIPSFKAWKSFHRPNTFVLRHYDVQ